MNDVITVVLILFLLVTSVFSMYQVFHENDPKPIEPQKTVTTETLIPTHVAKCVKRSMYMCTKYEIYRVTTP